MYQIYWLSYLQFKLETSLNIFKLKNKCWSLFLHFITSFQGVFLSYLSKENSQAFEDLLKYGFGAKSSGETSRKIHGNVVKKHFKEESKGTAEPCRWGYIPHYNTGDCNVLYSFVAAYDSTEKLRFHALEKNK